MKNIVIRRNIQSYCSLLDFESNEMHRRILLGLLFQEERKLSGAIAAPPMLRTG